MNKLAKYQLLEWFQHELNWCNKKDCSVCRRNKENLLNLLGYLGNGKNIINNLKGLSQILNDDPLCEFIKRDERG